MSTGRAADQRTRRRLLDAATRLFAERGFRHVTVRAICREARANVAAVNYHFRDKLGLYREVIESSTTVVRETTEQAMRAGAGKPPAEQLRAYIRVHCERILASSGPSHLQQLVHREMNEPTEALGTLVEQVLQPRFEYLFRVIGALLDLPPSHPRVALCGVTVHGLVIMFRPNPVAERVGLLLGVKFTPEEITDHVLRFALAGTTDYVGRLKVEARS